MWQHLSKICSGAGKAPRAGEEEASDLQGDHPQAG
jgi:hypothetical protein